MALALLQLEEMYDSATPVHHYFVLSHFLFTEVHSFGQNHL